MSGQSATIITSYYQLDLGLLQAFWARTSQTLGFRIIHPAGSGSLGGGDILIRCTDGGQRYVPSTLLEVSLPNLIRNATPSTSMIRPVLIDFPYSSNVLTTIIKFLRNEHSRPSRHECTNKFVTDCFEAAHKYELVSLMAWLRSELAIPNSPISEGLGPIRAYVLCNTYCPREDKKEAFRRCIGKLQLDSEEEIDEFIHTCSDKESAFELVRRLAFRSHIITEIFSTFHVYPLDTRSRRWEIEQGYFVEFSDLTCSKCQNMIIFRTPSWLAFWAHHAKNKLLVTPGDECDHVFRVGFLGNIVKGSEVFGNTEGQEHARLDECQAVCQGCLKYILHQKAACWEDWAAIVKAHLKDKLKDTF